MTDLLPGRAWVQNVETGKVRSVAETTLQELQSPWKQITADEAVQAHLRSVS